LGESGSGKEMVARMIYKASARSHRTFLKVNCAALPDNLLESELFGYEQGAFTGAQRSKPGKFELCDKGTILLDEIGEMSPAIQAKLLHVLQDQEFSRLGSRSSVRVDVRILAATNIDVSKALASKKLREDLYYRLCAFTINVPPLRERKSEVPALMRQFMTRYSESYGRPPLPISQRLIDACQRYPWPGNLRELSNFVRRYLILADESWAISELNAGPKDSFTEGSNSPLEVGAPKGLKSIARDVKSEAEAQAIVQALEQASYNRRKAAVALEISYKALLYKIKKYGIVIPSRSVAPDPYKLHF
jgi:transcriptional regulator with PAS, ATPase and Fis domain